MYNGSIDENVECTICYGLFLYPVRLPCKHRFCKLCLERHVENNNLSCPLCRVRVSNWLRQLRRNNEDIVDKPFWETIQRLYPKEIKKRLNGDNDQRDTVDYTQIITDFSSKEKSRSLNVHTAIKKNMAVDWKDDWRGWPDPVFTVCRNIIRSAAYSSEESQETLPNDIKMPRRSLYKPGELRQEYEQLLQKELEDNKRREEENFRLSEAMIKMIEEDEKREEEERLKQLKEDEELARRLEQERTETATVDNGTSVIEARLRSPRTPKRRKLQRNSKSLCGGTVTLSSSGSTSTSQPTHHSPIPLDQPSTSKEDIFAKFWTSANSTLSSSSQKSSPKYDPSTDLKTSSISNKEFSHFATVHPGPSTPTSGPKTKNQKTIPSSRCSSGCDSIGQEFRHFKPIRCSPTTPPKEGSRKQLPQVVVAQRGMGVPDHHSPSTVDLDLIAADIPLEELENSMNLEKQLEEDKKLALKIQKEMDMEAKQSLVKPDYNLRKRKRPSGNTTKRVLIDRTQTTLDNLLIK